jgi:hypothetical protein
MTVTAEDDIRRMMRFQEIEHDWSVCQYHRVTAWNAMRNAIHIGAVGRGIVETHDAQLSVRNRDDDGLIDQEVQFVAIGQFEKLGDRHAAVMVVIAQRHIHGRETSEVTEKSEQMRQTVGHIEQIAGDKNPVRPQLGNRAQKDIVARHVIIKVQVANLDRTPTAQWSKRSFQPRHAGNAVSVFIVRNVTKEPIQWARYGMRKTEMDTPSQREL